MGCPFKGRADIGKDVMMGDGKVCHDILSCADMISGIGIPKEIHWSPQNEDQDNDEYDICDGGQKPEGFGVHK